MSKLLSLIVLVTVCKCYGHYPPAGEYGLSSGVKSESSLGVAESVLRSISESFGWNFDGQLSVSREGADPDVVVVIVEYQSNGHERQPPLHHGHRPSHQGHQSPPSLPLATAQSIPPPPSLPLPSPSPPPYGNLDSYYNGQHAYQQPARPHTGFYTYENQYFKNQNFGTHAGVYTQGANAHAEQYWKQQQGNYNNQASSQLYQNNRPTDHNPGAYDNPKNQNHFNENNQWYLTNVNKGLANDRQESNNGGLNSGIQNTISNYPNDGVPTVEASLSPFTEDKVAKEPVFPRPAPLEPMDSKSQSSDKNSAEEDEDFKIDIRFKAE